MTKPTWMLFDKDGNARMSVIGDKQKALDNVPHDEEGFEVLRMPRGTWNLSTAKREDAIPEDSPEDA